MAQSQAEAAKQQVHKFEKMRSSSMLLPVLLLSASSAVPQKRSLVWVANPLNQTRIDAMIADMRAHRESISAIAYQYWAICGEGSNDEGGSKDCSPEDAKGGVHLAPGHPTGVPSDLHSQLISGLGNSSSGAIVELWPTISYGNPGNASVLNRLLANRTLTARFAADAIKFAHAQSLSGYNIDIEVWLCSLYCFDQ